MRYVMGWMTMCLVCALVYCKGGDGEAAPDGSAPDAASPLGASLPDGSSTDGGGTTQPACQEFIYGSCQCVTHIDFPGSDCDTSANQCIDYTSGKPGETDTQAAQGDCASRVGTGGTGAIGSWSDAGCPAGRLGGCKQVYGNQPCVNRIRWYYADPDAGVLDAANVMALCDHPYETFVSP